MVFRRLLNNPRFQNEVENQLRSPGEENDIMSGLIPVGDTGLYRTPDEAADPTDCARYPDSPFCGGIPFTLTSIGIEPEIINDGCNIGIRLNPAIAFIRLPPVAIVYRKPECRLPELPELPDFLEDDLPARAGQYRIFDLRRGGFFIDTLGFISAVKIPGVYLDENDSYQEDWIVYYYDCDLKIQQLWNANANTNGASVAFDTTRYVDKYLNEKLLEEGRAIPIEDSIRFKSPETGGLVLSIPWKNPPWRNPIGAARCPALITSPPPPKEICCMQCCPPPDDALLKALYKKIKRLEKVIGVEEYPASLPKSLISKDEGFIGNLIPNGNDEIPNLTQLIAKFIKYYDEIQGQWEVAVEIKDSDPSTPGDQPKGIKLPNMAEAIAEMFTLMFQTHINSETLLNIATRNLVETGTDKQQNFISYKLIQSISDYLGYKQKERQIDMPLMFSPEKTRFDEFLKESAVKVATVEFDEKFGLEADLMKIRKMASILDSVYFKKINPNGDVKAQILKNLIDTLQGVDKVNKGNEESNQNWENFLRQVEEGYGQVPGVTDPNQPYGRDYAERPKIRDLTDFKPPETP